MLIIGAGAAGLSAGVALARAGRAVTVLEARSRLGGRIFTLPGDGDSGRIELGAEFIHGRPASLWSLIDAAGLPTYELEGSEVWCAAAQPAGTEAGAYHVLEDMTEWMALRSPERDLAFADYLAARGVQAEAARPATRYVEGFNAADSRRISVAALAEQQRAEDALEGNRLFRIRAGYATLIDYLARELTRAGGRLEIARPVHRVRWQRGAVTVECRDESGRGLGRAARCVVLTVPLGVLKAGALELDPPPVALLAQAARLEMGHVLRVVLKFARPVWQDAPVLAAHAELAERLRSLSFLFTPDELPATWWTPRPDPAPLLTGWLGGPRSAALEALLESKGGLSALRAHCTSTLARVLGEPVEQLDAALLECHVYDWRRDPFSRGAYSYVPVGALDAPGRLAVPVEDTLFLAGEHTHTAAQWGTVHAALESGARAARQVMAVQ